MLGFMHSEHGSIPRERDQKIDLSDEMPGRLIYTKTSQTVGAIISLNPAFMAQVVAASTPFR
jgi:hypothetical protein